MWRAHHSERVRGLDTSAHTRVLGGAVLGGLEKAQDGIDRIEPPSLTGDLVQAQPDGRYLLRARDMDSAETPESDRPCADVATVPHSPPVRHRRRHETQRDNERSLHDRARS